MQPNRKALIGAFANMALAVVLGAFGAHALRDSLSEQAMAWYHTGHNYHMWCGLGWIAAALAGGCKGVSWLFGIGFVLFSGSLYAMALTGETKLGMITPLGGICFIVAFGWMAWRMIRTPESE